LHYFFVLEKKMLVWRPHATPVLERLRLWLRDPPTTEKEQKKDKKEEEKEEKEPLRKEE
jgi:hypothetical protein